jgi:hypothetical protein
MPRGCRRGNQVLIFLSEADLPLEPWRRPCNQSLTQKSMVQIHARNVLPTDTSDTVSMGITDLLTTITSGRIVRHRDTIREQLAKRHPNPYDNNRRRGL